MLYNFDNMVDGEQIVLVEGPFDVMSLDKQGIKAVATFGKKISKDQIKLLEAKHPSKVILMYDSDALGTIQKTFDRLNKRFDTAIAVLPNGDPGDCINPLYYVDNAINNPMDIQLLLLEAEFNHEQMVLCG